MVTLRWCKRGKCWRLSPTTIICYRCYREVLRLLTKINNLIEALCKVILDYFQKNLKHKALQSKVCCVRILFTPLEMNKLLLFPMYSKC